MGQGRVVFRAGPRASPGALPQSWEVLVSLREFDEFLRDGPCLWPSPAEPLVELCLLRFARPTWEASPPVLLIAETSTETELAALLERALRERVPALLFAPPGLPITDAAALPPSRVRIISRSRSEKRKEVALRAARALEALVRAQAFRDRRLFWRERLHVLEAALATLDAAPPPLATGPQRMPLDTVCWAHARELRGFAFASCRQVHVDLGVDRRTALRWREEETPEALRRAFLDPPAASSTR